MILTREKGQNSLKWPKLDPFCPFWAHFEEIKLRFVRIIMIGYEEKLITDGLTDELTD